MSRPHPSRQYRWRSLAAVIAVSLAATACGASSGEAASPGSLTVVATTSIWADVVANLACDGSVEVETIIPAGADPHAFEASLADRGQIEDAVLVVANGLGLEEGLVDTIDASETPVFEVSDHIETIAFAGGEDHADEDDQSHDGEDPHVWMDPTLVAAMLPTLADALIEQGVDAPAVQACLADYQTELAELDAEIAAMTESLSSVQRTLVTGHDALGYFADRYGFTVIGTVIPAGSTLAETNPADLEALALLIDEYDVSAIFAESQQGDDEVNALASRVGDVAVVTLYTGTLGEGGSGADTYVGLLRRNADLLVEALR